MTPARSTPLLQGADDSRPILATLFGADYSALSITPAQAYRAPAIVRAALARFSTFDARHGLELARWCVRDLGDAGVANMAWEEAFELLGGTAARAYGPGAPFALGLGGDHSVTWPLVDAFTRAHGGRVGLLQLDVHHDVRPLDDGPSNGTPVRGLIESGVIRGSDIFQIGIHPFGNAGTLHRYCDEVGIRRASLGDVATRGARQVVREGLEALVECAAVYLTVDIDVLDRAFAPGTVAALPGGLTPAELAAAVDEACSDPRVLALDVVEFDPTRDVQSTTAYNVVQVLLAALSARARLERDTIRR